MDNRFGHFGGYKNSRSSKFFNNNLKSVPGPQFLRDI